MLTEMTEKNKIDIVRFKTIWKYNNLFWGVWILFYTVVFWINIKQTFVINLLSSVIQTLPLYILSLLLWPLIRKMQYSKIKLSISVVMHFVASNLYSTVWLSIYYCILVSLYGEHLEQMLDVKQVFVWQYPVGITFYLMIAGAYYSLIYYCEIKAKEIKESRLEMLLKETQLSALKSQLNPHFLFNALNSINALIGSEPKKAREMLIKLSDLLRLSISKQKQGTVSLSTELEFVHIYLDIEKIRLEERLDYNEQIDSSLMEIEIPPMILQPLIENAVKHGIAPVAKKGFVKLAISVKQENLKIEVSNSMPSEKVPAKENSNTGLGQQNIKNRLLTSMVIR